MPLWPVTTKILYHIEHSTLKVYRHFFPHYNFLKLHISSRQFCRPDKIWTKQSFPASFPVNKLNLKLTSLFGFNLVNLSTRTLSLIVPIEEKEREWHDQKEEQDVNSNGCVPLNRFSQLLVAVLLKQVKQTLKLDPDSRTIFYSDRFVTNCFKWSSVWTAR